MYNTLAEVVDKVDNDSFIEDRCNCMKPCNFMNPTVMQEFSVKNPGLGEASLDKSDEL